MFSTNRYVGLSRTRIIIKLNRIFLSVSCLFIAYTIVPQCGYCVPLLCTSTNCLSLRRSVICRQYGCSPCPSVVTVYLSSTPALIAFLYVGLSFVGSTAVPPAPATSQPSSTDTLVPVLLSETRQQNTEVRLSVSKMADKVDKILEKVVNHKVLIFN